MSDKVTQEAKDLANEVGLSVQPDPVANDRPSAHDLVAVDLMKRKEFGLRKYGTLLQAGNGRDSLQDAYEEALDLMVYLRTLIEERTQEKELKEKICKIINEHCPYFTEKEYIEAYRPACGQDMALWQIVEDLREVLKKS